MPSGAVFFILIVAVLAAALAWMVASLYRRRMLSLMRGGTAPLPPTSGDEPSPVRQMRLSPGTPPSTTPPIAAPRPGCCSASRRVPASIALTQPWLALVFVPTTIAT